MKKKNIYIGTRDELEEELDRFGGYWFDDGTVGTIKDQLNSMKEGFGILFYNKYPDEVSPIDWYKHVATLTPLYILIR